MSPQPVLTVGSGFIGGQCAFNRYGPSWKDHTDQKEGNFTIDSFCHGIPPFRNRYFF